MMARSRDSSDSSFLNLSLPVLLRKTNLADQIDITQHLQTAIDGLLSKSPHRCQYYQLLSFYLHQCNQIENQKLLLCIDKFNILIETAKPEDFDSLPVFLHFLSNANEKHPDIKSLWTKNMSKIIQSCFKTYHKHNKSEDIAFFVLDILNSFLTTDNATLLLPQTNQIADLCLDTLFPSLYVYSDQICAELNEKATKVYTLLLSYTTAEKYSECMQNLFSTYTFILKKLSYAGLSVNMKVAVSVLRGERSGGKEGAGGKLKGLAKANYYREMFHRLTNVLVEMLETRNIYHSISLSVSSLYLPLYTSLLSYTQISNMNLQDRLNYLESDEGMSKVDTAFIFPDLQCGILKILQTILSHPQAPSYIGFIQSASTFLTPLFVYLYKNTRFSQETGLLTSVQGSVTVLCSVLDILSKWIRLFPMTVWNLTLEYEKIYHQHHIIIDIWKYVISVYLIQIDPHSSLLAPSEAMKDTNTSIANSLDAKDLIESSFNAIESYVTFLSPYFISTIRSQITVHMHLLLQHIDTLLQSHKASLLSADRHMHLRCFLSKILHIAHVDLTMYPNSSTNAIFTPNLLLLQDISRTLLSSCKRREESEIRVVCSEILLLIGNLLAPSQVILPPYPLADLHTKYIQAKDDTIELAERSIDDVISTGKRAIEGRKAGEEADENKKRIRLEDMMWSQQAEGTDRDSNPTGTGATTTQQINEGTSTDSNITVLATDKNAAGKCETNTIRLPTDNFKLPSSSASSNADHNTKEIPVKRPAAIESNKSKEEVKEEDDEDDDLPEINLEDD